MSGSVVVNAMAGAAQQRYVVGEVAQRKPPWTRRTSPIIANIIRCRAALPNFTLQRHRSDLR